MPPLSTEETTEAQQYHLKAQFILNELHANIKVYGSNHSITGANPAKVNLALQYINRSLEIDPENAVYMNLKALLLWEGLEDKKQATQLLEKALALKPRDIDIQNNLKAIKRKPKKITPIGYLGIGLGILMLFAGISMMGGDDAVKGFYIAAFGVFFIVSSTNLRR